MNETVAVRPNPGNLPDCLKGRDQWVAWMRKTDTRSGRVTKPPIAPGTGRLASVSNPSDWGSFAQAWGRMQVDGLPGVGFVFTDRDPYVGIDLDGAYGPDGPLPWAQDILDRFPTYAEVSASGTGIHLILEAQGVNLVRHRKDGIEAYDRARYFVMTGQCLPGREEIRVCTDEFRPWYADTFLDPGTGGDWHLVVPSQSRGLDDDDEEILANCRALWPAFARLHGGDTRRYEGDESRADLAYLNFLVKAGVSDHERLRRLIRASGLKRRKLDRDDYLDRTIRKALDGSVRPGVSTPGESGRMRGDLDDRNSQVESAVARAAKNGQTLERQAGILRNRKLGVFRAVAMVLAIKFACLESLNLARPYQVSIIEVAEAAGISRAAASRHLRALRRAGVIEMQSRWVPNSVDSETGEVVGPKLMTYIAPVGGALEFAVALGTLDLTTGWGGKRPNAFGKLEAGADKPDGVIVEFPALKSGAA